MRKLTVIPGHVRLHGVKALIISPDAVTPTVDAVPKRFPSRTPVSAAVSPVPVGPGLSKELGKRGIHLFLAEVDGLDWGETYLLRARAGTLMRRTEFRTLPPASHGETAKIVVASCFYRHFRRDPSYLAALWSVYCRDAAFKILMGDNLYMDVAPGQGAIWDGYDETAMRYVSHFHESGYADVLARLPTVTTYDDHEFWNNYPEEQPHLGRSKGKWRAEYENAGQEALDAFQAILNPPPVIHPDSPLPAPDRSFRIDDLRPVSIFVADIRSRRTLHEDANRRMLDDRTLAKLIEWTKKINRPGVLVLGQPLLMERGDWKDYNPPDFERQYEAIVDAIATAKHDVLVVAGDVHFSRLTSFEMPGGRTLHEFVCSPASHIPALVPGIGGQGRGSPEVPGGVKTEGRKRISLRFQEYWFGTGAPNCIGVLTFTRRQDGKVAVDAQFLNLAPDGARPPTPAASEILRLKSGHAERDEKPEYPTCSATNVFQLK